MYSVRPLAPQPLGPLGTSSAPAAGADDQVSSGVVELEFGFGDVDFRKVRVGDLVWRTKDASLEQRVLSGCAGSPTGWRTRPARCSDLSRS